MIFVTVGTHEQQFNRLIKHIDEMDLEEEIIMQIGYSTYKPIHYRYSKFLPYKKMMEYVEKAAIVITHGGPSSIMLPLQIGKAPIVVPRKKEYGEHVNNHQVEFAERIEKILSIVAVYNIEDIDHYIKNYSSIVIEKGDSLPSNNTEFNYQFSKMVERIL